MQGLIWTILCIFFVTNVSGVEVEIETDHRLVPEYYLHAYQAATGYNDRSVYARKVLIAAIVTRAIERNKPDSWIASRMVLTMDLPLWRAIHTKTATPDERDRYFFLKKEYGYSFCEFMKPLGECVEPQEDVRDAAQSEQPIEKEAD